MSVSFWIFIAVFILLFFLRVPVAFSMVASSVLYFIMEDQDLSTINEVMIFGFKDKFVLLAVPLFIFTARVMNTGGITERIFDFAGNLVGHFKGGLGHVNVVASIIFSGMTGSAIADASGLGLMEIKAMDDAGYRRSFSSAVTVASATIGPIIPPSIPMVIYAMLSGASVGALFLGGIVPGILMGSGLMAVVYFGAIRDGYERGMFPGFRALALSFKRAFFSLLTPVILLGGIYSGAFTPTEAAAVAALYALVLLTAVYRSFGIREALAVIRDVVESTGFLGFIIAGAFIFGHVLATERVPLAIAEFIVNISTSKIALLLVLNVLFLILGCFVDTMVLLLVVVPVVLPAAEAAGIDMVHLGVILVMNMMIGLATPPFGMLLFTISGLTGTPIKEIIQEMWPFLLVLAGVLLLCTYIPQTVLWLPGILGG